MSSSRTPIHPTTRSIKPCQVSRQQKELMTQYGHLRSVMVQACHRGRWRSVKTVAVSSQHAGSRIKGAEMERDPQVLVVDDLVPDPRFGYGYPRSFSILKFWRYPDFV
jgi:hypothetical protein